MICLSEVLLTEGFTFKALNISEFDALIYLLRSLCYLLDKGNISVFLSVSHWLWKYSIPEKKRTGQCCSPVLHSLSHQTLKS